MKRKVVCRRSDEALERDWISNFSCSYCIIFIPACFLFG